MRRILMMLVTLVLTASLVLVPAAVFAGDEAADDTTAEAMKLSRTSVTFGKAIPYDAYSVWLENGSEDLTIVKAVSSRKKVAGAKVEYGTVNITPKKVGKTTITVTDSYGRTAKIKVTVKKKWKKANLNFNSWGNVRYESKKAQFYSKPGAKITLKIAGKKYTKKVGKKGFVTFKLKKHYKLKTKFKATFRYKGAVVTKNDKVSSSTSVSIGELWTCKNQVPITVYNALKGDKVYITVYGKTYKEKITYSGTYYTTFYTDSNLGYISSIGVKVKNRYKQTIYKDTKTIYWN